MDQEIEEESSTYDPPLPMTLSQITPTSSISTYLSTSRKRSTKMRRLREIYDETEIIDGDNLFCLHLNQKLLTIEEDMKKDE